jgi:D-alanyl-D-alanine carboxypeptidase
MQQNTSFSGNSGYSYGRGYSRPMSSKKRRAKKLRRMAALLACVALGVALAALLWHMASGAVSGLHTAANYGTATYDTSGYVFNAADPYLILVNNNMPLAEDYAPQTVDAANGKQLVQDAAAAYQAMAEAAQKDGVSLMLCSGYRDYDYQAGLFQKREEKYLKQGYDPDKAAALAQTVVAKPGCSEHQTGLAADIVTESHQGLDSGFASTDAFAWLNRYAPDYGFILRYPESRQASTGIIYEPWHWRYVGVANAQAITQSGLSLEEFLALHTTAADVASAAAG